MSDSQSSSGTIFLVLLFASFGYYIYASYHRYELVSSGNSYVYQIDKKTGETFFISGENKFAHKYFKSIQLPDSDISKIDGKASFEGKYFKAYIDNQSQWSISEILFEIKFNKEDGGLLELRKYKCEISIEPFDADYCSILIEGEHKTENFTWNIVDAKGYKE